MPIAPRHPCPGKGPRISRCTNLVGRGERCCPECLPYMKQQTRAYDVQRDKDAGRRLLHSRTWRAVRMMKLNNAPCCERCMAQGNTVAAVLVHHRDGNELNNLDSNHESLCVECHEAEHKGERWGKG
jgi:hypothetical protein